MVSSWLKIHSNTLHTLTTFLSPFILIFIHSHAMDSAQESFVAHLRIIDLRISSNFTSYTQNKSFIFSSQTPLHEEINYGVLEKPKYEIWGGHCRCRLILCFSYSLAIGIYYSTICDLPSTAPESFVAHLQNINLTILEILGLYSKTKSFIFVSSNLD